MKTQDNKSILIELDDEGWKFNCDNFDINIDNGLYLGIKNSYKENQNICISGISTLDNQTIKWDITNKIREEATATKSAGLLILKGLIPADFITIISLSFCSLK